MSYDRELLLYGEKRNAVLGLREIQCYGTDNYDDPDYVCVYGMRPAQWHAKGIRLMGRTAVECTRDNLGRAIGRDVAAIARGAANTLIVDPFSGSGNSLYWLLDSLPGARGLGFELDAGVFELTRKNFALLDLPIEIQNTDYLCGFAGIRPTTGCLLVVFIAPPWSNALDPINGLDLGRTQPPISEIVDHLLRHFEQCRLLCVIQIYETIKPESLAELDSRFDWRALRMYGLDSPGRNHGILLGTSGWKPPG